MENNVDAIEFHYDREAKNLISFLKSGEVAYEELYTRTRKVFGLFAAYLELKESVPPDMAASVTKKMFALLWEAKLARHGINRDIRSVALDVCLPTYSLGVL